MRTPRVADWSSSSAPRCSPRLRLKLEQDEVVKVLSCKLPSRRQSGDSSTDDRDFDGLPVLNRYFEASSLAQQMSELDVLPDDLTVRKPARRTVSTRRHRKRRTEESSQ